MYNLYRLFFEINVVNWFHHINQCETEICDMEHWKRKRFVKDFLALTDREQADIIALLREFEIARRNAKFYHNQRPIYRTQK